MAEEEKKVESKVESQTESQTESKAEEKKEATYKLCSELPIFNAVDNIRFDYNNGLRISHIPTEEDKEGKAKWIVQITDDNTNSIFQQQLKPGETISTIKKFFIPFSFQIFKIDEATNTFDTTKPIFTHKFDLTDKDVMIEFPVGTIGDTLGWFIYANKFRKEHPEVKNVIVVIKQQFIDILKNQYPNLVLITKEEIINYKTYATYFVGLFFQANTTMQPYDFRQVGLHRTAGYILGVDPTEEPLDFDLSAPRQIKEKYVCIASKASSQAKYWNNPTGWIKLVEYLKNELGYRVLCIDKDMITKCARNVYNYIPYGCEDFTGDLPLQERINLLKDADFFVGLASGLSWVAWCCRIPTVVISGFSNPLTEFYTPYRVINLHACHGCWDDQRENFDHKNPMWCPRHQDDDQQFECTRIIQPEQVINTIKKIPVVKEYLAKKEAEKLEKTE